jgi:hypothetical protein
MALTSLLAISRPKKSRFSWPTPSNGLLNGFSPIKIIMFRAIQGGKDISGINIIMWDQCFHVGSNVIMWDELLSCGIKCYHVGSMLSCGIKCYHVGSNVIMFCYHVMLSCDVIIGHDNLPPPTFIFLKTSQTPFKYLFYKLK